MKHGVVYAPEQSESRLKRHRYDTIVEGVGLGRLTANFACVDAAPCCPAVSTLVTHQLVLAPRRTHAGRPLSMTPFEFLTPRQ